ncbi:FAD/NAD(P)-binding domain-containing protein [Dendrothele bispora CBS 962.96]|uniref:FAD/NAD(P)-binding domain-containing protein n=1 Tax=Dendrothele bispora (strain CBS 962.96) TaxID=1314807 RepID=A0A4S8L2N1_DENBC|nr:FAD/NAD(P)-binding domain-containing protein [Dendrothele bispora CBS 962.96]
MTTPDIRKDSGPGNSRFTLGNFYSDEPRRMKVVVIGTGFCGITAGIRFLQKIPNLELVIYEANAGVGGVWFANRYPGVACDVAAHCYQLSYEHNPNWSSFYSPGSEIRDYLQGVAEKYKLLQYIKFQHKLLHAEYHEESGKWHLKIQKQSSNSGVAPTPQRDEVSPCEEFVDTADVLFTGIGLLNRWDWPEIDGLDNFQGKVVHSAQWETGEGDLSPTAKWEDTIGSWKNKKIGVIGIGSSAIQIVTALQPKVAHLTNFVRSKTWISATLAQECLNELSKDETASNYKYTDEDKKKFQDPVYYNQYRRHLERDAHAAYAVTLIDSPIVEQAQEAFKKDMIKRLAKKPWIVDHIVPDFAISCKRLTPGPGYLEALCEDNVDFVPDIIKRVTPKGIETVDGKHRELDVIICATGRDLSFKLPFPVIGRNGVTLNEKFDLCPRTYLAMTVDGFPNWFIGGGPNSGLGHGSIIYTMERQVEYAIQATLKMQRERLKSMEVKKEATVYGQKCRSWYKMGKEEGRVVGLWPGSSLLVVHALSHPRWEDYNYEPLDANVKNRFYWLGDGSTMADNLPELDSSWYLDPKVVDVPPGNCLLISC